MGTVTPIRCQSCGAIINKKPKARTPKYCPPCRQAKQEAYKEQIRVQSFSVGRPVDSNKVPRQ